MYPHVHVTSKPTKKKWRPYYRVSAGGFPCYASTSSKRRAQFYCEEAKDCGLEAEVHEEQQRVLFAKWIRRRESRRLRHQLFWYRRAAKGEGK